MELVGRGRRPLALPRVPTCAVLALAARGLPAEDDAVAGRHPCDPGPDLLDCPNALVAEEQEASTRADEESALRRAERRREAAEQAAVRTRTELVALQARLEGLNRELSGLREAGSDVTKRCRWPCREPPTSALPSGVMAMQSNGYSQPESAT